MKGKKLIIPIFLALSSISFSEEIGLEDVLGKLDKNNPEIQIQKIEIEADELEVKKRFKTFLPGITLTADQEFVKDSESEKNDWDPTLVGPERITTRVPLFTGGKLRGYYEKSKIAHRISQQELNIVRHDMEEAAIASYFKILNLRTQAEITQMVLGILEKQRVRLESLYKNGKFVPKSEVLKVESDILSNQVLKLRREKEQRTAQEELFLILGMSLDTQAEFKEFDSGEIDLTRYSFEGDSDKAVNQGSLAQKEKLQLEDAQQDVKIARAEYYPDIYIKSEYRIKKDDDEYSNYQVGVTASWNIFSWGSTLDNIRQKELKEDQAYIRMKRNLKEIDLVVRSKYREIETLYEEVNSQKLKLSLEKENMKIDNLRYTHGLISSLDYLNSVERLQDAEEVYYTLQRGLVLAEREYENLLK